MRLTYTEETEMDKTILIVEDEPILREVLKDFFLNESYQVFEAEDGREALTLFTSHHIDLVVLDIMLPKLDGWSVCQTIRDQSEEIGRASCRERVKIWGGEVALIKKIRVKIG